MSEQNPLSQTHIDTSFETLTLEEIERQKLALQGLNIGNGFRPANVTKRQLNYLEAGYQTAGNYPDVAIQSSIDLRDKARKTSERSFREVVDEENNNHLYAPELKIIRDYYASKGLLISPIRIMQNEAIDKAYDATGGHFSRDPGGDQGRNINGRSIIVEDQPSIDIFGADYYVLNVGLHEAAHALSGNRLLRTVRQSSGRVALGGYDTGGLGKADLRRNTETTIVGEFWEEAFADLTRVKALRELGRSNDFKSGSRICRNGRIECLVIANDSESNELIREDGTIIIPAEFALMAKTSDEHGRNMVALGSPNFAAYALYLLDQKAPGLYDDFLEATQNPRRQADAIAKIESIKPGLYRMFRDLSYNEKDFTNGLRYVLEALGSKADN